MRVSTGRWWRLVWVVLSITASARAEAATPQNPNEVGKPAEIEWAPSFELALERARAEKKLVMADFFTLWCSWCKKLDRETFRDPDVVALTERTVNVKVNAGTLVEIASRYGVSAFPTILFLNPDGSVRTTVKGFQPPDRFVTTMESALAVAGRSFVLANQVQDRPSDRALRRQYVEALALEGRWEEAAKEARALLRLAAGYPEELAVAALDLILYRQRCGEQVDADLSEWARAHEEHPRVAEALFRLAESREQAGELERAREGYTRVRALDPTGWFGYAAALRLEALSDT